MKKLMFMLLAVVAVLGVFTSCEEKEDMVVSFNELPAAAQATVNEYWSAANISVITFDKDFSGHEYKVLFKDATSVEFDKNGEWESIESITTGVPTGIIPAPIAQYLATNYADQKVTEIDREKSGYDVKVGMMIELKFDTAGNLIGAEID